MVSSYQLQTHLAPIYRYHFGVLIVEPSGINSPARRSIGKGSQDISRESHQGHPRLPLKRTKYDTSVSVFGSSAARNSLYRYGMTFVPVSTGQAPKTVTTLVISPRSTLRTLSSTSTSLRIYTNWLNNWGSSMVLTYGNLVSL